MDREVLVREIKKLARELEQEQGPLAVLMLVSSGLTQEDDWNVVVSARGFNGKTRAEGIREVIDTLRRTVSKIVWPTISQVTVLRTDDPFVTAVTSSFKPRSSVVEIQSYTIAGMEIAKALIFTSRKVRGGDGPTHRRPRPSPAATPRARSRAATRNAAAKTR